LFFSIAVRPDAPWRGVGGGAVAYPDIGEGHLDNGWLRLGCRLGDTDAEPTAEEMREQEEEEGVAMMTCQTMRAMFVRIKMNIPVGAGAV
jgi:hypothetical protein